MLDLVARSRLLYFAVHRIVKMLKRKSFFYANHYNIVVLNPLNVCVFQTKGYPSHNSSKTSYRRSQRSGFVSLMLFAASLFTPYSAVFAEAELVFKSNFAGNVSTEEAYTSIKSLTGTDTETGYSWSDLSSNPIIDYWKLQYVANAPYDEWVNTEILPNFKGQNDVLHLEVKGNDPYKSAITRNELQIFPRSEVEDDLQVYIKYLMYLPPYVDGIDFNGGSYINMLELKDRPTAEIDGFSWRFNVNIRMKDQVTPYWHLKKEYKTVGRTTFDDGSLANHNVPVPIGEWFTVELFFKKDVKDGRIWFAINGSTVFDYSGRTLHPDPDKVKGVQFLAPFKNYRGSGHSYPYSQYYSNIEVWTDIPPKASVSSMPSTPTGITLDVIK